MSLTKQHLAKKEEYENYAKEILCDMGAIKFCACGATYCDTGKYARKDIFGIATNKLKEKYPMEKDFKLFDKVLDNIFNECTYDLYCPICEEEN